LAAALFFCNISSQFPIFHHALYLGSGQTTLLRVFRDTHHSEIVAPVNTAGIFWLLKIVSTFVLGLIGMSPRDINYCSILAASWAALGICYNSGQELHSRGSRVYVQETIYG